MKTTLKTIAASLLVLTFIGNNAVGQDIAKNDRAVINTNAATVATTTITDPGVSRIANKFAAMFPAAQNQVWATDSKGQSVSFINEGRKTRAGFTINGLVNYVITDCNMDQLSTDFQNFISKNYEGYQLLNGIDIISMGDHTQQAIMQNASGFVTLQATKDGIEAIQKVKKSN